jgi:DNA helicase-2/ATP-dependent DNA helicase PcrA
MFKGGFFRCKNGCCSNFEEDYLSLPDYKDRVFMTEKKLRTSVLDIEEERRLMYVAITRAKRYMYISYSKFRKGKFNQKSRFLSEIEKSIRRN